MLSAIGVFTYMDLYEKRALLYHYSMFSVIDQWYREGVGDNAQCNRSVHLYGPV